MQAINEHKAARAARYERRKASHKKDGNHGKCGWVAGNPRYNRRNPTAKMGRN